MGFKTIGKQTQWNRKGAYRQATGSQCGESPGLIVQASGGLNSPLEKEAVNGRTIKGMFIVLGEAGQV